MAARLYSYDVGIYDLKNDDGERFYVVAWNKDDAEKLTKQHIKKIYKSDESRFNIDINPNSREKTTERRGIY